jgi:hypothetical protein
MSNNVMLAKNLKELVKAGDKWDATTDVLAVHALPSSSCHTKGRKFLACDWRNNHVVVCSVTVLARLFGLGHHCQVDQRPGNTAIPNVIIEAVSSTQ